MTGEPIDQNELDAAISMLYGGPLEEFVGRRDALAKQLRASGKREAAARIKALRKPSRTAWILNKLALDDSATVDQLAADIAAVQTAQSGTAVRTALENMRHTVRAVAHAGARVAIGAGRPVEANALITAVHAVIGDANALAELRAGRLVDVPEGGGLDILSAVTLASPAAPPIAEPITQLGTEEVEPAATVARADLERAQASLAEARERLQAAQRAVLNAQTKLDAAEQQLQRAQKEANARRADLERAQQDATAAASRVQDAEREVADTRRHSG